MQRLTWTIAGREGGSEREYGWLKGLHLSVCGNNFVLCAVVACVCALPKRRLTSAATAALATCRKLTKSTARRNKLVLPPLGGLGVYCVPRETKRVSRERQRHANKPQAPQSGCRSFARRLISVINKSKMHNYNCNCN